jgi:hypothetical protein
MGWGGDGKGELGCPDGTAGSSPGLGPVRNDKNDKGVNGRGAYFLPVLSSGVVFGEDELADEDLGDEELAPAAIAEGGSEAL